MTQALAAALAKEMVRRPLSLPHATVIALEGPLGAGKTTFTGSFARAMGIRKNLPSPTFIFVRRYPLRTRHYRNLFHVDAYRVRSASKKILAPLGILEELKNPKNLFLIEWAGNVRRVLPSATLRVKLSHARNPHERVIEFKQVQ